MDQLLIWTVYFNPMDCPGRFVAREYVNGAPTSQHKISHTESEVMDWVFERYHAAGHSGVPYKLDRDPADHPTVLYSLI